MIVSALLVALVSLGVYMGIDGASATSGINKHRSVATELAQQDQDRMRAMTVTELSNYRDIARRRSAACSTRSSRRRAGSPTRRDRHLHERHGEGELPRHQLAGDVANMTVPPVTVESLIAPPNGSFGTNQGSLAVQVRDRNGAAVPGAQRHAHRPAGLHRRDERAGCVLWGYLPVGNYTVLDVAKPGYVDPSGDAPEQAGRRRRRVDEHLAFDYDPAADPGRLPDVEREAAVAANGTAFTASTPT